MESVNIATNGWADNRGLQCFFTKNTTSTNDWAKTEFGSFSSSQALYLTDSQSHGRGRYDRTWTNTKPGEVLLSTFCFQSMKPMQPIFTPLVGLAVHEALASNWPQAPWSLKAPNDIYMDQGKICGILIESATNSDRGFDIFVGIGLNVYNAPEVDVPTAFLSSSNEVNSNSWFSFLDILFQGLQDSVIQGERSELNSDSIEKIYSAMSGYPGNNVDKVFPDGSLQVGEQIIDWRDL